MSLRIVVLLFVCCFSKISAQDAATIIVQGSVASVETDDNFVCATLDWWPPEKCNYNQCPWANSSILNLDLNHPFLGNAIEAFNPLRIRIGGTLQDRVVYEDSVSEIECLPFEKKDGVLLGFTQGCLTMARWDDLNHLFLKTRAILTFGLNALNGRSPTDTSLWVGDWDPTNALTFMEYTISKGYPVDSWEFGNELSGEGIGARVTSDQYAKDVIVLKAIMNEIYNGTKIRPFLVAPGGFLDQLWYGEFLQKSGPNVVDALSHHIYNLGAGNDPNLVGSILKPRPLEEVSNTYRELQLTIERHGPWASAWVSEAGGAFNSGGKHVSNTFINSFWYLDQLGLSAKYGTKAYCRQTLIGANYGLLDTESFLPNPDYYSALLWHRIMGRRVLSVDIIGSPYLKAYSHCSKKGRGIAVLLINLSRRTKSYVGVRNDMNVFTAEVLHRDSPFVRSMKRSVWWLGRTSIWATSREEYHLTAKDGNEKSRTMLLNGTPLELTKEGNIPEMNPIHVALNLPLSVAPLSIAFVVFPNFEAKACRS